jgi:hypothetical protein
MIADVELWRPVVGFERLYEVSNHGNVRSVDRVIIRNDGMRIRLSGRQLSSWGKYPTVSLGRGVRRRVHHLVLEAFCGPRPSDMQSCHYDDAPINNIAVNLRWDTASANIADQIRNGRHHNSSKIRCKRGHLLVAPNLRGSHPGRACIACQRGHDTVRAARNRHGIVLDLRAAADRHYAAIMGTRR